ncbi:MAG: hypothetical protein AAF399_11235 [Bacteroidota bacterium]
MAELGGAGSVYSVNYLHQFESETNSQWEIKTGLSSFPYFSLGLNAGIQRSFLPQPHRMVIGTYGSWATGWAAPGYGPSNPGWLIGYNFEDIQRVHFISPTLGAGYRWEKSKRFFFEAHALAVGRFIVPGNSGPPSSHPHDLLFFLAPGWQGIVPWFSLGIGWKLRIKDHFLQKV